MNNEQLTPFRGLAAVLALAMPVAICVLRAQTLPPPPQFTYDVVSVRPAEGNDGRVMIGPGPQGGMRMQGTAVMQLLTFAYDAPPSLFADVPAWAKSDRYDVTFTPDQEEPTLGPGLPPDQRDGLFSRQRQRMQAVLRDRFGLVLRSETRELPLYALTLAKGGPKLTPAAKEQSGPNMRMMRGQVSAKGATMKMLTQTLAPLLGRPVVDETGLEGAYDIEFQWTPDRAMQGPGGPGGPGPGGPGEPPPPADGGGSIFTALTEQLGLKLESRKGPAPVLVVEKLEKPEAN